MNASWLDVKLAFRILAKYPGLSAVAVLGMALAIAIGAGYFAAIGAVLDSTLPVSDGGRIVALQTRTVAGPETGDRSGVSPHDFLQWRGELKSITDLGAFREDSRNLITVDGRIYLVTVAEMTASSFRLARVAPRLGRTLLDQDERAGAAPVVVIGYDEWRRIFDGDPGIIGASVRLGDAIYTVVGVMPEGFAFPVRHHYWIPITPAASDTHPDAPPSLQVFGRISDGFSLADARAELAAIGDRMAVAFPNSHRNVRPQVLPYTQAFIGVPGPELELALRSFQIGVGLLLLIVAVNVAVLVYARTATRTGEIVVRTALGASRARVIAQLFIEALLMSVGAAGLGLTIVGVAFRVLYAWARHSPDANRMPYWFELRLTPGVVAYVAALAVIAAIVVGVLPALKATGKHLQGRLQQFSSRGSGMQLGRTWTALIVGQVAVSVAVLPVTVHTAYEALVRSMLVPAAAANGMLRGTLAMSAEHSTADTLHVRYATRVTGLLQRLEAEPEVAGVTFSQHFPGQERYAAIETDTSRQITGASTRVATNFFDVFGVRRLAGRGFVTTDALPGAATVIVDENFAQALAPGANVIGRRVRFSRRGGNGEPQSGPWLEIVGVVPAFGNSFTAPNAFAPPVPTMYQAAAAGESNPAILSVRVRDIDPGRFAQHFREISASVDPALRLENLTSVVEAWKFDIGAFSMLAIAVVAVTASVLLLSAAGIYAMMSFTVSRRRREIGIRAALGADARRVLVGIFGRASAQLGAGIAAGVAIAALLEFVSGGELMGGAGIIVLPGVLAVMITVGLLAAIGPARRGLAIEPTEALREE